MKGRRAVLLDLDDTLYVTRPGEDAGLLAVVTEVSAVVGRSTSDVEAAYKSARAAVKARIDGRGSSHARLLYLTEMVHALGRPDLLGKVRGWERVFWQAFLGAVRLRRHALPFLEALRAAAKKVAIVTDLTLEVQLWKLEAFGLGGYVDAIAASEEVPLDKPAREIFELAIGRLGVAAADCVMVGDHDGKDGEGARRLGIPFVPVRPEDVEGEAFVTLAREMEIPMTTTASDDVRVELGDLAKALGGPVWVQGPGGNVSVKDGRTLWVKASGTRLATVATPGGHVGVDRDDAARALDGDAEADARIFSRTPRPSLETYFHAMGERVVAHTHPVTVLLAACGTSPERVLDLPVVRYERPGRGLALAVARVRDENPGAHALVLESHGLLVDAPTAAEAVALSNEISGRAAAAFGVDLSTYEALVAAYLAGLVKEVHGGAACALPPRAHSNRYLFPDAVVYASVVRADHANAETLPAAVAALGRAVVVAGDDGSRVAFAKSSPALSSAIEVLAAHDWVEDILSSRGVAHYLADDEPEKILDLPSEKYRMRLG